MIGPIGKQAIGLLAWDGISSYARDVSTYEKFAWTLETTGIITVPAVFTVQAAPPSALDPCVPGAFSDVNEVVLCDGGDPSLPSRITIPAGPAGRVCQASIPCKPNVFVRLVATSGDTANVRAVLVQTAPN